jgi:hypothetical protein
LKQATEQYDDPDDNNSLEALPENKGNTVYNKQLIGKRVRHIKYGFVPVLSANTHANKYIRHKKGR